MTFISTAQASRLGGGWGGISPPKIHTLSAKKNYAILLYVSFCGRFFSDLTTRNFSAENLSLCLFIPQQGLNTLVLLFSGRKTCYCVYFFSQKGSNMFFLS